MRGPEDELRPPHVSARVVVGGALSLVAAAVFLVLGSLLSAMLAALLVAGSVAWAFKRDASAPTPLIARLFFLGLAVRVALIVAISVVLGQQGHGPLVFDDEPLYDRVGWGVAKALHGLPAEELEDITFDQFNGHAVVVGVVYFFAGHDVLVAKLIVGLIGALAAPATAYIAVALGGRSAAWLAGTLAAVWPSSVLWSATVLKDAPTETVIAVLLAATIALLARPGPRLALATVLPLAGLGTLREFPALLFGWLAPASLLALSRAELSDRVRVGVPFAVICLTFLIQFSNAHMMGLYYLSPEFARWATVQQADMARGARTNLEGTLVDAPPADLQDSTGGGFLESRLSRGLVNVVLEPSPWRVMSLTAFGDSRLSIGTGTASGSLQRLAVLPEMVAWYGLLAACAIGLVLTVRRPRSRGPALLLAAYLVGMMVGLGVFETNAGTLFRHRSMLFPMVFPLAAAAMARIPAPWQRGRCQSQ